VSSSRGVHRVLGLVGRDEDACHRNSVTPCQDTHILPGTCDRAVTGVPEASRIPSVTSGSRLSPDSVPAARGCVRSTTSRSRLRTAAGIGLSWWTDRSRDGLYVAGGQRGPPVSAVHRLKDSPSGGDRAGARS
jgi:hypothetical protein